MRFVANHNHIIIIFWCNILFWINEAPSLLTETGYKEVEEEDGRCVMCRTEQPQTQVWLHLSRDRLWLKFNKHVMYKVYVPPTPRFYVWPNLTLTLTNCCLNYWLCCRWRTCTPRLAGGRELWVSCWWDWCSHCCRCTRCCARWCLLPCTLPAGETGEERRGQ